MGGGDSSSSSATSGAKITTGPVTFGGVSFGAQGSGTSTITCVIGALAVALLGWYLHKKR